jgi:hypothetical protein
MKKFELTSEFNLNFFGRKFFRIKALVNIERYGVKAGDLGGWVEKEDNLSQSGDAWVSGNAKVSGDAVVSGNAKVSGDAVVYGDAKVSGDAWVSGDAVVSGDAEVSGDADYAVIKGFGTVYRPTTFFRCHDGEARVTCGCFYGTIDEFREQVKRTRKGKVADEYLKIADLMEYHFKEEDSGENV